MRPTNPAEVRAFLEHRALERPRSEVPVVQIDGAKATLRLFDPIDSWGEWWGMSAKEFANAVDELPSHITTIELLINSPGGDAFDGTAIMNVLRAHPARTVAVVQGIAASAASFIACAADECVMAPNSTLMIHEAWGICVGSAKDMVAYAGLLDKVNGNMADVYAAKCGGTVDAMRGIMAAETWYTAEEAVAAGFADSVAADEKPPEQEASARWTDADLQALAAEIARLGTPIPSAGEREETTTGQVGEPTPVDPEQASRLLATLTINKETPHE